MPPDVQPNPNGTKYPFMTSGAPIAIFWNVAKKHNSNAPQKNETTTQIMCLFRFAILSVHLVLI